MSSRLYDMSYPQYTVHDVSALTGLTPQTIRYYDGIGVVVPRRGAQGQRLYSYYDVLNLVRRSLYKAQGFSLQEGVYCQFPGPCYETPAEIQAYKAQGADVVGMSTVPEAVFAKACGMKIAGISLVSNLAAGISRRALNHEEVMQAGASARTKMAAFIDDFLARI